MWYNVFSTLAAKTVSGTFAFACPRFYTGTHTCTCMHIRTQAHTHIHKHSCTYLHAQVFRAKLGLPEEPVMTGDLATSTMGGDNAGNEEELMHMLRGQGYRILVARQQQQQQQQSLGRDGQTELDRACLAEDDRQLLAAARSHLASLKPEDVTLRDVKMICWDFVYLVRRRFKSNMQTVAGLSQGQVVSANWVLDQLMEKGSDAMGGMPHLASVQGREGVEQVVRVGDVPMLLRAYRGVQ